MKAHKPDLGEIVKEMASDVIRPFSAVKDQFTVSNIGKTFDALCYGVGRGIYLPFVFSKAFTYFDDIRVHTHDDKGEMRHWRSLACLLGTMSGMGAVEAADILLYFTKVKKHFFNDVPVGVDLAMIFAPFAVSNVGYGLYRWKKSAERGLSEKYKVKIRGGKNV